MAPNTKRVDLKKINTQVWLGYMKKTTITIKIKEGTRRRGQILVGTGKGTSRWWAHNCGKVWWPCIASLASRLANVIRQGGRERGILKIWF